MTTDETEVLREALETLTENVNANNVILAEIKTVLTERCAARGNEFSTLKARIERIEHVILTGLGLVVVGVVSYIGKKIFGS